MGRHDQGYLWRYGDIIRSDQIQRICVTDKGYPSRYSMSQALLRPVVLAQPGANHNNALVLTELGQPRRIIETRDHQFWMPGKCRRNVLRVGGQ